MRSYASACVLDEYLTSIYSKTKLWTKKCHSIFSTYFFTQSHTLSTCTTYCDNILYCYKPSYAIGWIRQSTSRVIIFLGTVIRVFFEKFHITCIWRDLCFYHHGWSWSLVIRKLIFNILGVIWKRGRFITLYRMLYCSPNDSGKT